MKNAPINDQDVPRPSATTSGQTQLRHSNDTSNQDTVATSNDNRPNTERNGPPQLVTGNVYTLSALEARQLLIEAGYAVSERTIIRWCKKGLLEATLRPEENGQYEKYYITRDSVTQKIEQLNRVQPTRTLRSQQHHSESPPSDFPAHSIINESDQDIARSKIASESSTHVQDSDKEVQDLRDQLLIVKVDVQVKDKLLVREREATREAWDKVAEIGEQVGKWKARCERLELGPRMDPESTEDNTENQRKIFRTLSGPHNIIVDSVASETDISEIADENQERTETSYQHNPNRKKLKLYVPAAAIIALGIIFVVLVHIYEWYLGASLGT